MINLQVHNIVKQKLEKKCGMDIDINIENNLIIAKGKRSANIEEKAIKNRNGCDIHGLFRERERSFL